MSPVKRSELSSLHCTVYELVELLFGCFVLGMKQFLFESVAGFEVH